MFLGIVFLVIYLAAGPESEQPLRADAVRRALVRCLLIIPVGGADMPVVIAILNALTGLSAAARASCSTTTCWSSPAALVGSSGSLLTVPDGARDEPLDFNVLFGAWGARRRRRPGRTSETRPMKDAAPATSRSELAYADKVIVVPGYGLAVAQAQHSVRELADELEERGVEVNYAIHPVAGRMPGHMNVLLAEADVPYDDAQGDGRDQPRLPADRRRPGDRRQRRHEPGRARRTRAARSTACRSSTSTRPSRSWC